MFQIDNINEGNNVFILFNMRTFKCLIFARFILYTIFGGGGKKSARSRGHCPLCPSCSDAFVNSVSISYYFSFDFLHFICRYQVIIVVLFFV